MYLPQSNTYFFLQSKQSITDYTHTHHTSACSWENHGQLPDDSRHPVWILFPMWTPQFLDVSDDYLEDQVITLLMMVVLEMDGRSAWTTCGLHGTASILCD